MARCDSIELLGIIDKRQALHVVTTQPFIRGEASSTARIIAFMRARGFVLLPEIAMGRFGAVSFFRESDDVAAFDCHPANSLAGGDDLFPIDVLLVRASDDLRFVLAASRQP